MTTAHPPGITFASFQALGTAVALEVARDAAAAGFGSFWTAETTGQEAFATLGAVAAAVPGLGLGTGVLALQLRTPMLAAMGAATLQGLPLFVFFTSEVVALQALGTTFLLLVWLYVMANVIVFGAALNYVLAYDVTGREVTSKHPEP